MANANSMVPTCVIEGVYSTTPRKVTEPRSSLTITIKGKRFDDDGLLQKRMHIVLYYNKQRYENEGRHVAGWIKDSLGKALDENPIFAGRLRKLGEDGSSLELVANDSGIRCVEAQVPVTLVDFLQSSKGKNSGVVDAQLVYWKDIIDDTNLQFSPLFYVQVTNFQCGGYSVGISYSLLLPDPCLMAKFLNKWAYLHRSMTEGTDDISRTLHALPLFHTPNFKRLDCETPINTPISYIPSGEASKTMVYKIITNETLNQGDEYNIFKHYYVPACIETAENELSYKMSSSFVLITKDAHGNTKVETISKRGIVETPKCVTYEIEPLSLEELRFNEMVFQKENVPIHELSWVACCDHAHQGVVLVTTVSSDDGKSTIMVYITIPMDIISY